jgi:16S rRNA (guanine527-N7)-methyltransferase
LIAGLRAPLEQGASSLGVELDPAAAAALLELLSLLQKWNRVYNLTAIREPEKWLTHHLLDSLSVVPHLPAGRMLDVGSGAGFPGIPVAIVQPERKITLLDSNQKKGAFLRQAVAELALPNVQVAVERVEAHRSAQAYDVVISRAFSDLADFVGLAGHAAAADGVLAAMKGVHPEAEIARLPGDWALAREIPLHVPGLDAERHLLLLQRRSTAEAQ